MSRSRTSKLSLLLCWLLLLSGCFSSKTVKANPFHGTSIDDRLAVAAKHEFYDDRMENLDPRTQRLMDHLLEAAQIMDAIYYDQLHPLNHFWLSSLQRRADNGDVTAQKYLDYFFVSFGPWDNYTYEWIFDRDDLFVPTEKLDGFNVYPYRKTDNGLVSVTKEELDAWLAKHPEKEAEMKSSFTVVRFGPNGPNVDLDDPNAFVAIPYSRYYQAPLEEAARQLELAATYTDNKVLKKLLTSRAHAFRTDEYNATEPFWLQASDLDVQVIIGPYEESVDGRWGPNVDGIWGVKRGFGARIGFKDAQGTADLDSYKALGSQFQDNLPIDAKYAPDRQKEPRFTVWRQIFTAGDSRKGAQTLGQKLPNDRSVTIEHGARQNFYRNSQDGKCEKILLPIAQVVLAPQFVDYVTCDSFFKATLHHEYAHALGVAFWYPDWDNVPEDPEARKKVRKEINENLPTWGGPVEELKADTLGHYNRNYMITEGLESPTEEGQNLTLEQLASMVSGFFRSIRFGAETAYGKNVVIQMNNFIDAGVITFNEDGKIVLHPEHFAEAVRGNAAQALMLQVNGDDAAAGQVYQDFAIIREPAQELLDRITAANIPRDLYPVFPALQNK